MKLKGRLAFTLAEVLIVLGIIGMVAEMTLPTLINSTSKQTEISQLKKFYSSFEQGMSMYLTSQNCSDLGCTGAFTGSVPDGAWQTAMLGALGQVFKGVIKCGDSECAESIKKLDGTSLGSFFSTSSDDVQGYKLADGTMFAFDDNDDDNCPLYANVSKISGVCAYVYVDLNASKQPNRYGRDIFIFILANDGALQPFLGIEHTKYVSNDVNYSGKATYWRNNVNNCGTFGSTAIPSGVVGGGCAARIMENAWMMDY